MHYFIGYFLFLSTCGTVTVNPDEARELIGSCQIISQQSYLVKTGRYKKAGLTSRRLIVPKEFYKNYEPDVFGVVDSGTKIEIQHVIKDDNMTASCWMVEVEILNGSFQGQKSEIPACYLWHPPTWLNSIGPGSDFSGQLKLKSEYVAPCFK